MYVFFELPKAPNRLSLNNAHCTSGPIALKPVVWSISKKYLTMYEWSISYRGSKKLKSGNYSPDPEDLKTIFS